ncbi:MAG: FtsW/RodA/SpoVE family cell cycle protein, partial [Bacteroidaceae bacterium]|nr:FtsW/RodA/SpoVE family cell cycle protein [Bacteroidaceae bacterium]
MTFSRQTFAEKGILQGDTVVWMIFIFLCLTSIIEVYSACSTMSYESGRYWAPVVEHGAYVLMGFILTWVIHLIPFRHFKILSVLGLHFFAYPLLVMALFTAKINDAGRWVTIGGKTIQPSEFAKIALVGFVAFVLASFRNEKGVSEKAFRLVALEILVTLCLIVTENASTAGIIFLVMLGILFYAQAPKKYLAWIVGAMLAGGIAIATALTLINDEALAKMDVSENPILHRVPTWVNRVKGYERPADPKDYNIHDNLQVTHAKIAIATCGITGKGPGNSVERDYLPQAYSDFIYAIIIEEGGIFLGVFVMSLYLLLMWRAMKIAKNSKSLFAAYLVMGLALMMVVQAMINMAVAVGAFPVTGQPLPL